MPSSARAERILSYRRDRSLGWSWAAGFRSLRKLYRRIGGEGGMDMELLSQGPFVMNTRNHTLEKSGNRIRLTQVEYSILKLFMQNPGRALSREDILSAVWGREYEGELKIVDVNIRRLRIKIEDDTANPTYITTVWGFGYKWGA